MANFICFWGKFYIVLCKCLLLQIAKYRTNKLAIWSHCDGASISYLNLSSDLMASASSTDALNLVVVVFISTAFEAAVASGTAADGVDGGSIVILKF